MAKKSSDIVDMNKKSISNQEIKVAILATKASPAQSGGAERFNRGLVNAFKEIGCDASIVLIDAPEATFEDVIENYRKCINLDLSKFDIVISTKAPTFAINHHCHLLYLVHTVRVFDDRFLDQFPEPTAENYKQRAEIHKKDLDAFRNIKAFYAIGNEVKNRLYRWRGIKSETMHPPLEFNNFKNNINGDYFFIPGRLHRWKRIDLLIKSVQMSLMPLKLIIAGTGEDESYLKSLANNDPRIDFLGVINDDKLIELYGNSLAIPFIPVQEDYGYVTLEAFASGKPIITCTDSGEPAFFVSKYKAGLIAEPNANSICDALEWMYNNRKQAADMGKLGKKVVDEMSWMEVATNLLDVGLNNQKPKKNAAKVLVLDMQPIDPPVGGGRLRLLGLYHQLSNNLECRYLGSYDWQGEKYREHALSSSLYEINIPLSSKHHEAAAAVTTQTSGKNVIDIAFSKQGILSPEYINSAKKEIENADVVIFSHPWVYPLVKDFLQVNQVIVYDSQNVESYLRSQLFDITNPIENKLLTQVAQDEYDLCCRSDLVLACSHEDMLRFNRIYDLSLSKTRVIPNGVFAYSIPLNINKQMARDALGINNGLFVAIFIGSSYKPNTDAANYIINELAPLMPDVHFIIVGGVGAAITSKMSNVQITGPIDENSKNLYLIAADIAINPMFSGSGTNIKMFEFMAAKLPVVTTSIGSRGIDTNGRDAFIIVEANAKEFKASIARLKSENLRNQFGIQARKCIEENYAWERISPQLGMLIESRIHLQGQPKLKFSVVVPTYERHYQLDELIGYLQLQTSRDFEVIIVDQSDNRWDNAANSFGFPLTYYHSPVKGAVRARNVGAMLASGEIIAFIDDDCQPDNHWLLNATHIFKNKDVVGIEGCIESNHHDDPNYRPVSNIGFEGIGFMTANLLVRSESFQLLGGFDMQFDHPHFREDTDFGWRLLDIGRVPYVNEVKVFHPAQPRILERESIQERIKFFQKDALLYKKHPERYRKLFMAEGHYISTPGFQEELKNGFKMHGIDMPEWLKVYLDDNDNEA